MHTTKKMTSLKRSLGSDPYSTNISSKVYVRSTKSGKVQKVVRELYLRQDIPCSSKLCTTCLATAPKDARGIGKSHSLSSRLKYLLNERQLPRLYYQRNQRRIKPILMATTSSQTPTLSSTPSTSSNLHPPSTMSLFCKPSSKNYETDLCPSITASSALQKAKKSDFMCSSMILG